MPDENAERAVASPDDAALQMAVLRLMERAVFAALVASEGERGAFPAALHDTLWDRIDELEKGEDAVTDSMMVSRKIA